MGGPALLVLTTLGDEAAARTLITALLNDRLIACGTMLPGARSWYRWEGERQEESEVVVLMKTVPDKWESLRDAIERRHPYRVPELLALPVVHGLDRYLSWLASEVS